MDDFQQEFDLYLTPTTAHQAPRIDRDLVSEANMKNAKYRTIRFSRAASNHLGSVASCIDPFTITQLANISGQPAISLPTYVGKNGLPLGIQFIARKGRENLLLQIGKLFEDQQQFKLLN